jgi:hypothetical protein
LRERTEDLPYESPGRVSLGIHEFFAGVSGENLNPPGATVLQKKFLDDEVPRNSVCSFDHDYADSRRAVLACEFEHLAAQLSVGVLVAAGLLLAEIPDWKPALALAELVYGVTLPLESVALDLLRGRDPEISENFCHAVSLPPLASLSSSLIKSRYSVR